jgi:putative ATP-binding cassette transporter
MAYQPPDKPEISVTDQLAIDMSFSSQLKTMGRAFWDSDVRKTVLLLSVALLAIILATAYMQILLNDWNAPFYDSLQRRDFEGFVYQLGVFAMIAGVLLVLNVIQTWLNQMTSLRMREGLTGDLISQWMRAKRAQRLASSGLIGVNPDQRLHEDARNLSEITTSLIIGLVQSTILLVSFVGVLWMLSSGFYFQYHGVHIAIPGYMVWAAIIYAGVASLLSNWVGARLVGLNSERYTKEAQLRFSLMRANENLSAITLARGEENERRRINVDVTAVLGVMRHLVWANTHLTWVSAGYGWLAMVAPILIAAPVYFSGDLTFGGLMVAVGAFNQVNLALRWYVTNFGVIADWKATLQRVTAFRQALEQMDDQVLVGETITLRDAPAGKLTMKNIKISGHRGRNEIEHGFQFEEPETIVRAREKLMVNGDPGVNRRLLFTALAGQWPWGTGEIGLPPEADILFMPQTGYFPGAALREVLCYPKEAGSIADDDLHAALERVGLERLAPALDQTGRWDKILDSDEQARLRFANALVLQPEWIVTDDVLEGLEPETQHFLAAVWKDMTDTAIIYIGRSEVYAEVLLPRIVHLEPLKVAKVVKRA